MRHIAYIFSLFAISILTACATPTTISPQGTQAEIDKEARLQKEMALKTNLKEDLRIKNIAQTILAKNADLCPDKSYILGLDVWNEYSVASQYRDTANILYGLGEVAQISAVYKNGPAQKNGLKAGDKIIAINGTEIPHGKQALEKLHKALDEAADAKIKITYNRDGEELTKTITRVESCDYGVIYDPSSNEINAYADGKNIYVTRGMYRFTNNDKELALVISHELGHNAMGHADKQRTNATAAGLGGLALDVLAAAAGVNTQGAFTDAAAKAGAKAYSVGFEQEADYVGMYYMERAGYKTADVANFWRRMAAENNGSSIKQRSTHPASSERYVAIDKTYTEIQDKKNSDKPLKPEIDIEKLKKNQYQAPEPGGMND